MCTVLMKNKSSWGNKKYLLLIPIIVALFVGASVILSMENKNRINGLLFILYILAFAGLMLLWKYAADNVRDTSLNKKQKVGMIIAILLSLVGLSGVMSHKSEKSC